jgi:ribosomal protein S21
MAMIRVQVTKKDNESASGLIRRFTKKMQSSGILRTAKGGRYHERPKSDFVRKKDALKRISKRKEIEKLKKLGKTSDGYYTKRH